MSFYSKISKEKFELKFGKWPSYQELNINKNNEKKLKNFKKKIKK